MGMCRFHHGPAVVVVSASREQERSQGVKKKTTSPLLVALAQFEIASRMQRRWVPRETLLETCRRSLHH